MGLQGIGGEKRHSETTEDAASFEGLQGNRGPQISLGSTEHVLKRVEGWTLNLIPLYNPIYHPYMHIYIYIYIPSIVPI